MGYFRCCFVVAVFLSVTIANVIALYSRGWLLWLCVEVEIEDVAVLDLLFERGSDISLQLGLSALAEGHHVVRVDVKLV